MNKHVLPIEFLTSEKLTIDYVSRSSYYEKFFVRHFRSPTTRRLNVDRQKIVARLAAYNKNLQAPKKVLQNVESLTQPKTYVIITGQQPGLCSGPLYTIYKALSAITLCERLSDKNRLFVPIFWNASEDHDLSEVNHIHVFSNNEPVKLTYNCKSKGESLSYVQLDKSEVNRILTILERTSPNSEFKSSILREVGTIIRKTSTIGVFFSRFMLHLLGEKGLIMIEPHLLRDLMLPVFRKLIQEPTACTKILNDTGLKLRKHGYSPKIHKKPNMCNFFILNEQGARCPVTYDGKFHVDQNSYTKRELLQFLEEEPQRFNANAVIRPVTQDHIFPTFAYVAGPNEISYHGQLKGIYDFFNLEMPVLYPRFGATIVENKISKVLRKYSADIIEFKQPEKLLKEVAKVKVAPSLNALKNSVKREMNEVTSQAKSIDDALSAPCALARGRMLKVIEGLEDKIALKLKDQDVVAKRQIIKASNNMFPFSDLQERQINILEYLMKFGKRFLEVVRLNFLKADYGEHVVIEC